LFSGNQSQLARRPIYMNIDRADQCMLRNAFPKSEIYTFVIITHHPSQKHVQSFAGGIAGGSCNVLAGAIRRIRMIEKLFFELGQRIFYRNKKPIRQKRIL
jgi:hypothetical protein